MNFVAYDPSANLSRFGYQQADFMGRLNNPSAEIAHEARIKKDFAQCGGWNVIASLQLEQPESAVLDGMQVDRAFCPGKNHGGTGDFVLEDADWQLPADQAFSATKEGEKVWIL